MSPNPLGPNDILTDSNYFLWEFNARMALARKGLQDHVAAMKPEQAMMRETAEWKANDLKALAVLAKMLSANYQSMIREATTALEAWEILRRFFVNQNLHNRVQLRKRLHDFKMNDGDNLMDHLLHFDDLCLRLSAVGDSLQDDERLVILLGSLPRDYDGMIKIIEARGNVNLLEAKEMLRREYESLQRRDKEETAFNAVGFGSGQGRRDGPGRRFVTRNNGRGSGQRSRRNQRNDGHGQLRAGARGNGSFSGRCFRCNQYGHKQDHCPRRQNSDDNGEFVFSAADGTTEQWLLDSGASSHMTADREDFDDYRELQAPLNITVASGHRLPARGVGSVKFSFDTGRVVSLRDVLHVPGLDRKLVSVNALTAKGAQVQFQNDGCDITFGGDVIGHVKKCGKLYEWRARTICPSTSDVEVARVAEQASDTELWHARLGHPSRERMGAVCVAADGVPNLYRMNAIDRLCEGCARGKMAASKFAHQSGSRVKTTGILQLIHSDVMGPMNPKSRGGAQYVVTFVDDFSRFVQVFLIKSKSEVLARFKKIQEPSREPNWCAHSVHPN